MLEAYRLRDQMGREQWIERQFASGCELEYRSRWSVEDTFEDWEMR
jgi:hypothetical protein